MATKNLLSVIVALSAVTAQAQRLEPRSECTYESETTVQNHSTVNTRQTERCVEEPGVDVPKLHIGDIVRGTQLLVHPVIHNDFYYKQTKCRWFAQADTAYKDLVQYQGIACEIQPNVWRIIDKF